MKGRTVFRRGTIGPRMMVEDSFHMLSLWGVLYVRCRVVYEWNGRYVRLTLDADELELADEPEHGRATSHFRSRAVGPDVGRR
jgi:hypothetical protein